MDVCLYAYVYAYRFKLIEFTFACVCLTAQISSEALLCLKGVFSLVVFCAYTYPQAAHQPGTDAVIGS